jgi:hypothetical protein
MPRLGVVGTMVWDTIHAPGESGPPMQDWGGIAYSLAAFEAAPPPGWRLVPIAKVGADLRPEADRFLGTLSTAETLDTVITVPEGNNRVELFYRDSSRRCERLTGGVPGWTWDELAPLARTCDALYVNFIAGWELDVQAARALRDEYGGLTYCDVHSLLLAVGPDGVRELRPLPDREDWTGAFDILQVNEQELAALMPGPGEALFLAEEVLHRGPEAVLVTLGGGGAAWVARARSPLLEERSERGKGTARPARWRRPVAATTDGFGGVVSGTAPVSVAMEAGDPTGCGDVWGMACCTSLLAGAALAEAVDAANLMASRNAEARGTSGLVDFLRVGGAG